jgi:MFS family permease
MKAKGFGACERENALAHEPASAWLHPLLATMLIQTVLALLNRAIPTLAPVLLPPAGLQSSAVGYFDALNTGAAMAFLVGGHPLIRRAGPIRTLQLGLLLGGLGVVLLALPLWQALVGASLLMGLAYGPSSPAGSDILLRHAPVRHRTLIFSVKQAAVPLGGILAGLLLPFLITRVGWLATVGCLFVATIACAGAVEPVRDMVDVERDPRQSLHPYAFLSPRTLLRPLKILWQAPLLPQHALASACFACAQGAMFAFYVTFLVLADGYGLAEAGLLFALFQAGGIFGRVFLGWLADRLGSGLPILRATGVASATTLSALALSTPDWSFSTHASLAAIAGVTVSSWNGVNLAEVARAAPGGQVSETTAGVAFVNYIGFIIGPVAFAALLHQGSGYRVGFFAAAGVAALGSLILLAPARRA